MTRLRRFLLNLTLISLGVICPLLALEAGLRIENRVRKGTPLLSNPADRWDDYLGWTGKEHVFGPKTARPILVVGDSFTEGLDVPGSRMWFAELARRYPQQSLIAYGGLGYGTLQQLRILKRYHAQGVRPALVVLQLCSNDILNNLFELEKKSLLQRPPGPRPYLEGDTVRLRFPRKHDWLVLPLVSISRLAYRTSTRWDGLIAVQAHDGHFHSIETDIARRGFSFEPFRSGVQVTHTLLDHFKKEVGASSLILMLVDDIEPYSAALTSLARKLSVPLLIPSRIAPMGREDRLPDGTHLNALGNERLGRAFITLALERGLLQ